MSHSCTVLPVTLSGLWQAVAAAEPGPLWDTSLPSAVCETSCSDAAASAQEASAGCGLRGDVLCSGGSRKRSGKLFIFISCFSNVLE